MRLLALVLACSGCDSLFGLAVTSYTPPDTPDVTVDVTAIDTCADPSCQTFASCKALQAAFPAAPSGVYTIDGGTGPFQAYCELAADGGGWTLVLKVDGTQPTFTYDQPIWQDPTPLRPDAPDLDHTEAKLESWNVVAFDAMRVGLEFPIGSGTQRWLIVPISSLRLAGLFAPGAKEVTALGRDAWKGLLGPTASLQINCNQEGTNVGNDHSRMRIGIVSNQEADCLTPDSRIGIGGANLGQCTFPTTEAAGNSACFTPDNGEVEQPAFGWVLVR